MTARARADADKALMNLQGILAGIVADGDINGREIEYLRGWLDAHRHVLELEPVADIAGALREAVDAGVLSSDSHGDLRWAITGWLARVDNHTEFYSTATGAMQQLHGLLGGVAADDDVNDQELTAVRAWLARHGELHGVWPYDEVLGDVEGVIAQPSAQAKRRLLAKLKDIAGRPCKVPLDHDGHKARRYPWLRSRNGVMTTLSHVCESDPEITFPNRLFCFTGAARSGPRAALEATVVVLGGKASKNIVQDLDYLVIGGMSNPTWVHATYGRKIEKVMHFREHSGSTTLIIAEQDFAEAANSARAPK